MVEFSYIIADWLCGLSATEFIGLFLGLLSLCLFNLIFHFLRLL